MKTFLQNFKNTAVVSIAAVAAIVVVSVGFQVTPKSQAQPISTLDSQFHTVTITAKRWDAAQKLAFDVEQAGMQVVVISAKRLTEDQKIAMAKEDQTLQAAQESKIVKANFKGAFNG
jgi:hypothetical protein